MYEEYRRGYPRDEEYDRDYLREDEFDRGYPREEEYKRGYHHDEEEYKRGYHHDDEYKPKFHKEDEDRYSKEDEYGGPKNNECKCKFPKEVTVDLKEQVLCAARSVVGEAFTSTNLEVDIPPNAAITKINASILQTLGSPIDSGFLRIFTLPLETTTSLFAQDFNKSPDDRAVSYETDFVQPLCVGPGGARANLISLYRNVTAAAAALRITVVYCPNYCS